jgi:hypothetical protein
MKETARARYLAPSNGDRALSGSSLAAIRKVWSCVDQTVSVVDDGGGPLRKVASCAVVNNPFAYKGYVEDLSEALDPSRYLGTMLGQLCASLLGEPVESYGKAGIAGLAGQQEHVNAFLTSAFGDAFRTAIGGGDAWISSTTKVGMPGVAIDIPLAFKDEIWVRSHYDTLSLAIADAPLPDEIVIIAAVTNRGRLNARLGGMTVDEARRTRSLQGMTKEIP